MNQDILRQAARLRESGRYPEAEAAYKRVLGLDPNQPTCWYNLGFVQRMQGRFEDALASYEQALQRGVSGPEEVHVNRAVIYADHLRREDEAERELGAALRHNRRYAPALFNLANLKEDRGHRAEAMALYEQVLAIAPPAYEALARLAQIAPVESADDAMVQRVRSALAAPDASGADRASLAFALGRMLDQAGAYAAAFEAFEDANRASRASGGGRVIYKRAAEERLIGEIIAAFPQPAIEKGEGRAPIFICGMFRSGSTLTEQVLAGHPRVTAGGELDILPAIAREIGFPGRLEGTAERELAARYCDHLRQLYPDAERVTDKRPDNFLYIGLIKRLFPQAKIVHTTRHPLDNVLSIYFLHLDHSMGYALDLMDIAHHYRQYRRLMTHWKALYPDDILDFDYDVFVREPRPAVERLLAFLDLEWAEECMAFHRRDNAVKTASVWQVREPLYQRSSGRWRNYAGQLGPVRTALADLIGDAN